MSIEDRLNAVAKNVEGKVQEGMSEVTGNPQDKVEGRAKQREAAAMHAKEDLKVRQKELLTELSMLCKLDTRLLQEVGYLLRTSRFFCIC